MKTVQTTLTQFGNNDEELRKLVEARVALKAELDNISNLQEFGGLRRIQIVGKLDLIDEKIVELANLQVGHHSMTRVVVNNFIEGMI